MSSIGGATIDALGHDVALQIARVSRELLIRIAVLAGLSIALHAGRSPEEAGGSTVGAGARESRLEADHCLTPTQRLEAFLEHDQRLAARRHPSLRT
jgi:hypothetical protein